MATGTRAKNAKVLQSLHDHVYTNGFEDHTQSEAEMYRKQMVSTSEENTLLRENIQELQGQLQGAYKRIAELIDGNMERNTSDRN
jgi:uncharacterized coiled-coil DUF342 family protein